jgi:hypothetical protein
MTRAITPTANQAYGHDNGNRLASAGETVAGEKS